MSDAYIVGAVRSAGGRRNGRLSRTHPLDLGAAVVDALMEKTGVAVSEVDESCVDIAASSVEEEDNVFTPVIISLIITPSSVTVLLKE